MGIQKTCLLIGGRGFVGQGIAAAVARHGWALTIIGRDDYQSQVGGEFDLVINANGNARRFQANRQPVSDFDPNVTSVYRSLFDFRTPRYVLISTVDVYSQADDLERTREEVPIEPLTLCPYAFHKWLAETLVRRYASQWLILRLAQMVGAGLKKGPVFDMLYRQPLWADPESRLHFMSTEAVGEVLIRLVEQVQTSNVFNVCGRGSVPLGRILELLPPHLQHTTYAARDRQMYAINTQKTERVLPLPDSWPEVRDFVRQFLATRATEQA